MTDEPLPARVSDEDRTRALDVIVLGVDWAALIYPPPGRDSVLGLRDLARQALAALVSHGWGPKPTVPRSELTNWFEAVAYPDLVSNGVKGLARYLRECGIEVTE